MSVTPSIEDIARVERFFEEKFGRIRLHEGESIDLSLRAPLPKGGERTIATLWQAWAPLIYFFRRNMRMDAPLIMPREDCRLPPEDFRQPRMPGCHFDLPCAFFDVNRQRCRFRYPYAPLAEAPFREAEPSPLAALRQWGCSPRYDEKKLSLYKDERWVISWVKDIFPSVTEVKRTRLDVEKHESDRQCSLFDTPNEKYDEKKSKAFSTHLKKRDMLQHMIVFDEGGYDWLWRFMEETYIS